MSPGKHIFWCAVLSLAAMTPRSLAADFPEITPEQKALISIPQQPGASAVILYREETTDDTKNFRTVYVRLKVLTEAGCKFAEVEIPYGHSSFTLSQLSGRTVHADGSVVPLEDNPVERIVLRDHGVRMRAMTFTLPAVRVGSILDYRYSLHFPEGSRNAPVWMVQNELFQKKTVFKFIPTKYQPKSDALRTPFPTGMTDVDSPNSYEYIGQSAVDEPNSQYTWINYLPPGDEPEEHVTQVALYKWVGLEMSNVTAAPQEPDMPPSLSRCWRVDFFYRYQSRPEDYWKSVGKAWDKGLEKFLTRKKGIQEAVASIVGAKDNPETKLRKIYAAVSQMENETFAAAPIQTPVSQSATGVEDVWQKRSGTHDELNRLFVAMVRAAGIPATMMWVPDRGRTRFDLNFMSTDQLDGEIAIVQAAGQDVFLDPGTKFCPYGVLNWHYAGVRGLRQSASGGATLADTPAPTYQQAIIQRVARLQLTPKGTMEGTLAVGFSGQDAMVRRQEGLGMDAAGRKNLLENEIRSWLPNGTEVTLTNSPEWDKTEGLLVAKFNVSGPLAASSGKSWTLPVHVFEANEKPRLPSEQRTSPVFFDYASRRVDEVHIVLPSGMEVESLPPEAQAKTGYSLYTAQQKREGANGIVATRDLAMNSVLLAPSEYKEVKAFYDQVAASDGQPAILKGPPTAAR